MVVTKTGDIPLFLKDGESAYLVHSDDENEFAMELTEALIDTNNARSIGEEGFNVAMSYFNYKKEADKVIKIMSNI